MAFVSITKPTTGDPGKATEFAGQVIDDLNDLNSRVATATTSGVINGGMEIESSVTGVPEGWAWTAYTGGSIALSTTEYANGRKSVAITHPGGSGNGGGYLESSDYILVNPSEVRYFEVWLKNASGLDVQVYLDYYDNAFSLVESATAYDSIAAVASFTRQNFVDVTPATGRYAKIRLIGGHTDGTTAGVVYFDSVDFVIGNARRMLTAASNTASTLGDASTSLAILASAQPTVKVAAASAVNVALCNGSLQTNLNADFLDSKTAGNAAGDIPISNSTVCGTLNADMVDGFNIAAEIDDSSESVPSGGATTYGIADSSAYSSVILATVRSDSQSCINSYRSAVYDGSGGIWYWVLSNTVGNKSLVIFNNTAGAVTCQIKVLRFF